MVLAAGPHPTPAGDGMRLRDVAAHLMEAGVEEALAEAYVALLVLGDAKASEFARAVQMGRSEAYRLLQRLADAQLAEMTMDRPVRFRACGIDAAFDKLQTEAETQMDSLTRARAKLMPLVARIRAKQEAPGIAPTFRLLRGRPSIFAELRRLVLSSERTIHAIHTDPASNLAVARTDIGATMYARGQEGADVRILTPDDGMAETCAVPRLPGYEVRVLTAPAPLMACVVDERELLALTVADASPRLHADGEIAITTTAPALVASHVALFEAWWEKGRRVA